MPTASELESELKTLTGRYPGFGVRGDNIKLFDDVMRPYLRQLNPTLPIDEFNHLFTKSADQATTLIRQWMIAKEIDPSVAWKQSPLTLQNAYKGGENYVNVMKNNAANQRLHKKFGNTRGGRPVDIDMDLLDGPIGDELTPMHVNRMLAAQPATISASEIRKAVEQVAQPQLSDFKQRTMGEIETKFAETLKGFGPQIDWKIEHEVSQLQLGQHMTAEITRIAEIAAKQMAESMLPRRIEIKPYNGKPIELDREPRHEAFEEVLGWLTSGSHVYVVGYKGTGKTHMGRQLRDALRIAFDRSDYEARFIDQSLTKYDVKGYKGPTGEYIGTMVRDCVEKGWLMVIDEGDMWAAQALGSLNSILANDFGAFPDKVVEVHPDFRCVLCANTFGQGADREYNGRNPLDAASLDRFSFVIMDYDRDLEAQLYGISAWVQYVWRVREACIELKRSDLTPSMRAIREGLKALNNGMDVDMVAKGRLWRGLAADIVTKIKAIAGEPPRRLREVA